ncbi:MAG: UDP-N-acetylmuramoyl-L-alanyl-D-glutamate--2,6-diaminopimelate ligase [Candidatus Pacebacteria bacterium]|nr:UDP-N-acetylmuramoyl-L-alanyl-D-glutamate--2,6-diaminopimelate ligase [Candidatus Paceibacterota bacterium]
MLYKIKQKLRKIIPYGIILFTHKIRAVLAAVIFGFQGRKIRVIGVAGTKGKTTTVNMIAKVLEEGGYKVAMLSTANFQIGEKKWLNNIKLTTTSPFYFQKFLRRAKKEKCDYVIVEISSHGLVQFRHWGVKYKTVVLTNMMSDHLDYHKTSENYKNSHNALMSKDLENIIINYDDKDLRSFLNFKGPKKYIFTLKSYKEIENFKLIRAEDIVFKKEGSEFLIKTDKGEMPVQLPLIGEFNIYNSLATTALGLAENIKPFAIKKALESIKNIPGRLEKIQEGQNFEVIVDYAHSPDSLDNVYSAIKPTVQNRMIAVLGGTGDRDKTYRARGGELADKYADIVIVTNEDPYSEDPEEIIDQVVVGIKNKISDKTFFRISERKEAIQKAINLAQKDDLVIITGKGAEQFMICKEEKIPWDDREVARKALKNRKV